MSDIDLERLLNSVGKKFFVEYYDVLKNDNLSDEEKISFFPKNKKKSGSMWCICRAKKIFDNNLQKESLEIIIRSNRVDEDIKEKAKILINELKILNKK